MLFQTFVTTWYCRHKVLSLLSALLAILAWGCQGGEAGSDPHAVFDSESNWHWLDNSATNAHAVIPLKQDGFYIGSGFVIAKDRIMTNHHVVGACSHLSCPIVAVIQGQEYEARLVRKRHHLDFAVLQVDLPENVPIFALSNRLPELGETLDLPQVILDQATGQLRGIAQETGVLLAEDFSQGTLYLRHRINTLPGSSGSPILDDGGSVIGIHKGVDKGHQYNIAIPIVPILESMALPPLAEARKLIEQSDISPLRLRAIVDIAREIRDKFGAFGYSDLCAAIDNSPEKNRILVHLNLYGLPCGTVL